MFSFYKVALTKAALVKVIEDVAETRPGIIYSELRGYSLPSRTSAQPEMKPFGHLLVLQPISSRPSDDRPCPHPHFRLVSPNIHLLLSTLHLSQSCATSTLYSYRVQGTIEEQPVSSSFAGNRNGMALYQINTRSWSWNTSSSYIVRSDYSNPVL